MASAPLSKTHGLFSSHCRRARTVLGFFFCNCFGNLSFDIPSCPVFFETPFVKIIFVGTAPNIEKLVKILLRIGCSTPRLENSRGDKIPFLYHLLKFEADRFEVFSNRRSGSCRIIHIKKAVNGRSENTSRRCLQIALIGAAECRRGHLNERLRKFIHRNRYIHVGGHEGTR